MTVSLLLWLFVGASMALTDFRVILQMSMDVADGIINIVSTKCLSEASNEYSDWAICLNPSKFNGISIGLERCDGPSIKNRDIRLCIQIGSEAKNGTVACTDWASDGEGGWSDFAQTVDIERIYKARVMIETRADSKLVITDIKTGIRATDVNANGDPNNDAALWGKPQITDFLKQSKSVHSQHSFGSDRRAPVKAVKIYLEVDTYVYVYRD